jgi:NAD(P)-dependent dehydrogenase (short-subunit alcohol dehydrogenase family)
MSDRSVLVTGANRGIGLEFVRQYVAAGYRVIATCRNPRGATELRNLGEGVDLHKLDIASEHDTASLARRQAGTSIDILICNAAIHGGSRCRLDNLDWEAWRRVLEVNVLGNIRVAMALWRNVAASQERKIVVISSRAGLPRETKTSGSYLYRSSKAALNAAARCLALDLLAQGVMVAMLNPGHVKTGIGGLNAPMTASDSVSKMRAVIEELSLEHAGRFWHYDGTELPL